MRVNFANLSGKRKKVFLGFSIGYFLLGPIYLLFRKFFLRFLIITPIYVLLLWKGAGNYVVTLFNQMGWQTEYIDIFNSIDGLYFLIAIAAIHIVLSMLAPRFVARKLLKRGYIPFSELDTQKLIKHNLVKIGTLSYLATFAPVNGVGGQIKVKNDKELAYHLEQLAKLLKSGMISKDEYNGRRASIIMEK